MAKFNLVKRDYEILRFLWTWKIVSINTVHRYFFKDTLIMNTYKRLNLLKKNQYINTMPIKIQRGHGWVLTQKGYDKIAEFLPELEKSGFRVENPTHDFMVSAFQLEGLSNIQRDSYRIMSEQEIRRLPESLYPSYIPYCDYYNPDGYWCFNTAAGKKTIALEVELSRKAHSRYKKIPDFLNYNKEIQYCIWIVESYRFAKRLLTLLNEESTRPQSPHQFLLLGNILKYRWDSKILLGEHQGLSFNDLLRKNGVNMIGKQGKRFYRRNLLDLRIMPQISDTFSTHRNHKKA